MCAIGEYHNTAAPEAMKTFGFGVTNGVIFMYSPPPPSGGLTLTHNGPAPCALLNASLSDTPLLCACAAACCCCCCRCNHQTADECLKRSLFGTKDSRAGHDMARTQGLTHSAHLPLGTQYAMSLTAEHCVCATGA